MSKQTEVFPLCPFILIKKNEQDLCSSKNAGLSFSDEGSVSSGKSEHSLKEHHLIPCPFPSSSREKALANKGTVAKSSDNRKRRGFGSLFAPSTLMYGLACSSNRIWSKRSTSQSADAQLHSVEQQEAASSRESHFMIHS